MRIKELIQEKGMTYKEVYEGVGITKTALTNIVKGDSYPRADTLEKMAKVLGVPCGALFDDWDEDNKEAERQKTQDHVCPHCGKPIKVNLE